MFISPFPLYPLAPLATRGLAMRAPLAFPMMMGFPFMLLALPALSAAAKGSPR